MIAGFFGKGKQKVVTNTEFTTDEHGYAHANIKSKSGEIVFREASPTTIARKYMKVGADYNGLLQETKTAINDILNPIVREIEDNIAEYDAQISNDKVVGHNSKLKGEKGYWVNPSGEVADTSWLLQQYGEKGKWTDNAIASAERDGYKWQKIGSSITGLNWFSNFLDNGGTETPPGKTRRRFCVFGDRETDTQLFGIVKHPVAIAPRGWYNASEK